MLRVCRAGRGGRQCAVATWTPAAATPAMPQALKAREAVPAASRSPLLSRSVPPLTQLWCPIPRPRWHGARRRQCRGRGRRWFLLHVNLGCFAGLLQNGWVHAIEWSAHGGRPAAWVPTSKEPETVKIGPTQPCEALSLHRWPVAVWRWLAGRHRHFWWRRTIPVRKRSASAAGRKAHPPSLAVARTFGLPHGHQLAALTCRCEKTKGS